MKRSNDCESIKLEKGSQQVKRKSYTKPQITKFGHIKKLTQGGTGISKDGVSTKRPG
jgi:hypothetical protein